MGAFAHTPFTPTNDDRHGLKSSGHKGTDGGSVGGSIGGGSVGSGDVKGVRGGSVGSGEVDVVVEKAASAVVVVEPPSSEKNEVLKTVKPIPILKPKPMAISYIDQSPPASSSNRQQQLSVTFLDDRTHDNELEGIIQVPLGTSTNGAPGMRTTGTWIASPSLIASGGSGLQGGVSNYVQELLAVGVQDRAEGFSRSAQTNRKIPAIIVAEDADVSASFNESMNLMRQRRKGSASDANSVGSIDTIDEYQRILLAEIDAIDSMVMMSNGTTTPTAPEQPTPQPSGNKIKNSSDSNGGRVSPNTVAQLSPKSLTLAEAIAVVDSDTAAVSLYYNSLSSNSGNNDNNDPNQASLSTEIFKKSGGKKTAPFTSLPYRKMKRDRIAKLEAEVAAMNLKEKEWFNHTEELQATCQQLEELGALMEAKRIKALKQCREKDAIDLAAEISGINVQRGETNATLRTVHRDIFFLVLERERIAKSLQKLSEDLAAELKRSQRSTSLSKTLRKAKAALHDQQQQQQQQDEAGSTETSAAGGKQLVTSTAASAIATASASKVIAPVDEKVSKRLAYHAYPTHTSSP